MSEWFVWQNVVTAHIHFVIICINLYRKLTYACLVSESVHCLMRQPKHCLYTLATSISFKHTSICFHLCKQATSLIQPLFVCPRVATIKQITALSSLQYKRIRIHACTYGTTWGKSEQSGLASNTNKHSATKIIAVILVQNLTLWWEYNLKQWTYGIDGFNYHGHTFNRVHITMTMNIKSWDTSPAQTWSSIDAGTLQEICRYNRSRTLEWDYIGMTI